MSRMKRVIGTGISGTIICGCAARFLFTKNTFARESNENIDATSRIPSTTSKTSAELTLKQVQVFFRHGARTPIHEIPKVEQAVYDPKFLLIKVPHTHFDVKVFNLENGEDKPESPYDKHYNKKILKGGSPIGQLTSLGQEQTYLLGKQLRKDYMDHVKLIEEIYDPNVTFIRSTNVTRTIHSLQCVMAGLFGAQNLQKQGPIRLGVWDCDDDILLPNTHNCPVLRQINHAALIHAGDHHPFLEDRLSVEKTFGIDSANGDRKLNFIEARDDLVARKTHGLPVPKEGLKEWDRIEEIACKIFYYAICGQHEAEATLAKQLSGGSMLSMILENIDSVQKQESAKKLLLYSLHDSSLVSLLGPLGLYKNIWPPFAADLRIELYENQPKEQFVQVKYLGEPQVIEGCKSHMCPLEDFRKAIMPYTIQKAKRQKICHSDILQKIAKELLADEEGEVETPEVKETSDTPAGM